MKSFKQHRQERLVESSLNRVQSLLSKGHSIGIISASTGNNQQENEHAHKALVSRLRTLGYGPIQSTGRSSWGPERSLIVPNITPEHLKLVGNEFKQQAVIHVQPGGQQAHLHFLTASGDQNGKSEEIGSAHFNKPNDNGVTILKGIGFNPKDTRQPSRSFTFSKE